MELKRTFNEDERNYDRWRPTYVPELFADVLTYVNPVKGARALEIGIGTGQATTPFLQAGLRVDAVELGDRLAAYCEEKFKDNPNFKVQCMDFESFPEEKEAYDLIYSATAFHWIPEEISYPKCLRLLKTGGTLALFWNHPAPSTPGAPLFDDIQKIYRKYWHIDLPPATFTEQDTVIKRQALERYGLREIETHVYHGARTFTAETYVCLLNTYSDHRAKPPEVKEPFEKEMLEVIRSYGNTLTLHDTIDLYLGKK